MYSPFYMNISQWESYVQSGCCVCLQLIKNNKSTIQCVVCNCFNATKKNLYINIWQCMKYRSTTSLQSQIISLLSGQQQVKVVQSNQRRKHQLARFWPLYFGMHKVFCLSIILRNSKYYIALLVCLKEEIVRKRPQMKKKKVLFH